jgi:hypothetical protein
MIRYYYQKIEGKRHCVAYSTSSREELVSWGKNHGCDNKPLTENQGLMPRYDLGTSRAPAKPVEDNVFKLDAKIWRRREMLRQSKEAAQEVTSQPPLVIAHEPEQVMNMLDWSHPIIITDPANWTPPKTTTSGVFLVTPELAQRLIDLSCGQRPLSQPKVLRLATRMDEGGWIYSHQGLGFNKKCEFNDGNHRAHAVILCGKSIPFEITFGMDVESFRIIDDDNNRNVSDLVTIRRGQAVPNVRKLCAIGRAMMIGLSPGNMSKIDKQTQVDFVDWYMDLVSECYLTVRKRPEWARVAPLIAAFANAMRGSDEWPGGHGCRAKADIMPHLVRYIAQSWQGDKDPMKILHLAIERRRVDQGRTASGEDSRHDIYGMAVNALRQCLRGEEGTRVFVGTVEWGDDKDRGRRPRRRVYTGREEGHVVGG